MLEELHLELNDHNFIYLIFLNFNRKHLISLWKIN